MSRKDTGYALKSPRGRPHDVVAQIFDYIEDAIHVVVAALLVVAGAFVVWSVVTRLGDELNKATSPQAVVTFVLDKGLVIFIIAELLHTVRVTIQERRLVVEPFLIVPHRRRPPPIGDHGSGSGTQRYVRVEPAGDRNH